jgi:hypothetical protein
MVLSVVLITVLVLLCVLALYLVWRRHTSAPHAPWTRTEQLTLTGIISTATLTLLSLVVNNPQDASSSSGEVSTGTQPPTSSMSQSVVSRVMNAENPKGEYEALDQDARDDFDEAVKPAHYDVELGVSSDVPPEVLNSYTLPLGYECYDRTATVTARSGTGARLYSFELVGYWCARDGVVIDRKVRRSQEQVLMPVWERASVDDGSDFTDDTKTAAYLRSTYTFRLANLHTEEEYLYIVGRATGAASVCRALDSCPAWPT